MNDTATRVAVLGATGMLGSMVLDHLAGSGSYELVATTRRREPPGGLDEKFDGVLWKRLDAAADDRTALAEALAGCRWAINAIGVIKPYIHDDDLDEVARAIRVNSLFPQALAREAERAGCTVLQIATDCVYSGRDGGYDEERPHDALDAYGRSKSLGEARSPAMRHLRVSIIGPEPKSNVSLLEWFLGQERDGSVGGFRNHLWNGVTTLQFAKLCRGIIERQTDLPHLHHLVPGDAVDKLELLRIFAREYDRQDLTIRPTEAAQAIDRTLATADDELNRALWSAAGYDRPPSVAEMVGELAAYDYRLRGVLA